MGPGNAYYLCPKDCEISVHVQCADLEQELSGLLMYCPVCSADLYYNGNF